MGLLHTLASAAVVARIGAGLARCRLAAPRALADRLGDFPGEGAPVSRPVRVFWDEHAIPFVEAEGDADAAIGLGLVHAHLRLGQMEMMRRLAQGRLAEMLGPAALEADHGLRILGFGRAVPAILARMPTATRQWAEGFVAGINHYLAHTPRLPPEFALFGLGREPWTVSDMLTVGRLASADVNWFVLFNLVRLRARPDWPDLWADLVDHEGAAFRPLAEDQEVNPLADLATRASRAGSNALAVAGSRSASGAALMAADPHLNITLPNLWIAGGVKAPSLHATGLMIPGLPFIAIGRNRRVAWTGTSLQAASSDLFDARGLAVREQRERFRSRRGAATEAVVRETSLGPLVSDARLLGVEHPLALRWVGHDPSDELTAWLGIARATDWDGFRDAAEGLAVPGQNMVYADSRGRVGKIMAAHLPRRPQAPPRDAVLLPEEGGHWTSLATGRALPAIVDPAGGIVASANERPRHAPFRVGMFFSPHDRYLRLHRLAHGGRRLDLDDLAAFQQDVHSQSAVEMKTWLGRRLDHPQMARLLAEWDGGYCAESSGAAAFELLMGRLHRFAHGDNDQAAYWASWNPGQLMRRRLAAAHPQALARAIVEAAHGVAEDLRDGAVWGDLHRLRLDHPLGALPGLAGLARFADLPTDGGNETLMKTAHGLALGRHGARFGANARFLADLADPDRTRVVLLGGQDGWLGSATFLDQLALWCRGDSIPLPLTAEGVRARAAHCTVVRP